MRASSWGVKYLIFCILWLSFVDYRLTVTGRNESFEKWEYVLELDLLRLND